MSLDPRDYDGVTFASERAQRDERRELLAQEAEEREAREEEFAKTETRFCELDCFENLEHTAGCNEANSLSITRKPSLAIVADRRAA